MVYILIPAHNNKNEVLELLSCLQRQSYRDIKIVLVDDGSTDGTESEIRKSFPDTVILKGDGNLWWTGANVVGVNYIMNEAKDGDFILLLNNDLRVEHNYLETLVNASLSNEKVIVGSTTIDYDNPDFIESGVQLDCRLNLIVDRDKNNIESTEYDMNVDVLPGRGTLIPVEVFKKIGNFNLKRLPHYGADYEFTVRAKRAGFKLITSHKARVYAKLNITGLEVPEKKIISLRECYNFLFSKKSKTNFYYYLNYVWLCSEKKYRIINLFNNAMNILAKTVGKTIPGYPVFITINAAIFTYRFLFKSYPVRLQDIEKYGLRTTELINYRILIKKQFKRRDIYYYHINTEARLGINKLSTNETEKFLCLKRFSYSYSHKIVIIFEKVRALIFKKAI